jgi:hypothetical protein
MLNRINDRERQYLEMVKSLPCSCCDAPGPNQAHHVKQHRQYVCVALCPDCHTGTNGLHGNKSYMRIKKLDELDLINITVKRLFGS